MRTPSILLSRQLFWYGGSTTHADLAVLNRIVVVEAAPKFEFDFHGSSGRYVETRRNLGRRIGVHPDAHKTTKIVNCDNGPSTADN